MQRRALAGAIAGAAWILAFSPAYAAGVPSSADIRCLIVASRYSGSSDLDERGAGNMLAIYFMGRLEQFSTQEIEDAMLKEFAVLTPQDFQSDAERCGRILKTKGDALKEIGASLVRRVQEKADKAGSKPTPAVPAKPPQ
jgi:hypothetical protein